MPYPSRTAPSPPLAVAGFVCGVVGVCFSVTPFLGAFLAPAFAIAGIAFGSVGWVQATRLGGPRRLATAAVICGVVALVIVVAFYFIFDGWAWDFAYQAFTLPVAHPGR